MPWEDYGTAPRDAAPRGYTGLDKGHREISAGRATPEPGNRGRGYACVGGREEARLRRAVAAERETTPEDITIGYNHRIQIVRLCIVHPLS